MVYGSVLSCLLECFLIIKPNQYTRSLFILIACFSQCAAISPLISPLAAHMVMPHALSGNQPAAAVQAPNGLTHCTNSFTALASILSRFSSTKCVD